MHFSQEGERVPLWFSNNTWGADITLISTGLFSHTVKVGFSKLTQGEFAYRVSSAERAILEMLYCAPGKESLDEVKRIFMVLAEMYNHPWLEKLDISGVDFGKGKRSIVKGGYFHHKYNITVPADWKVQDIKRGI